MWHSCESDFTLYAQASIQYNKFENYTFEITAISPRHQWVNYHDLGVQSQLRFFYEGTCMVYLSITDKGCPSGGAVSDSTDQSTVCLTAWPSGAIWRHRYGSRMAQIMAFCLTAPSHYLKECWLIISNVLWHSSEVIIVRRSYSEKTYYICVLYVCIYRWVSARMT